MLNASMSSGCGGKDAPKIREAHTFSHQTMFRNSQPDLDGITVRFPAPDLAIARCRWTLQGHHSPEGRELPLRHGILVNLLQNADSIEGVLCTPQ